MAKQPASRSSPKTRGTADGVIAPATRNHSASHRLRLTGASQSAADLELGERPFDANRDAGGQVDAIDVRRHATRECGNSNLTVGAYYPHFHQRDAKPLFPGPEHSPRGSVTQRLH